MDDADNIFDVLTNYYLSLSEEDRNKLDDEINKNHVPDGFFACEDRDPMV